MKVLLIKDVYKLGRAGDIKKVANGYGRNFLIPQGLAILATPGAVKQAELIRTQADARRAILNEEMGGMAEILNQVSLTFPVKAGETGKLYGSITSQMIIDAVKEQSEVEINRRQLDYEPIRTLGIHKVEVRLTVDLVPEIKVIVHREGEPPESAELEMQKQAVEKAEAVVISDQVEPGNTEEETPQAVEPVDQMEVEDESLPEEELTEPAVLDEDTETAE